MSLVRRLRGIALPMLAGLVIDAVDFVTFGPIGISVGFIAGFGVGWWLAPELGLGEQRWLAGALAGVYCTLPMTGFVPAAALVAGLVHALAGDGDDDSSIAAG